MPLTLAWPLPGVASVTLPAGWLPAWCSAHAITDRLTALNTLAGRRLGSDEAALVWLHLLPHVAGIATPGQTESLLRQLLKLAPESAAAAELYDGLMNPPAARPSVAPAAPAAPGAAEIVFMVTSCQRYLARAEQVQRELAARGAQAVILVGDPSLHASVEQGPVLRLPVADTYEALPAKVLEGIVHLRRHRGPRLSIAKVDDDLRFSPALAPAALAALARQRDYVGVAIGAGLQFDRCWHLGKTSVPTPLHSRRRHGPYARGAMYLLGPRAVEHLAREWMFYPGEFAGHAYEDVAVGQSLRQAGMHVAPTSYEALGAVFRHQERYADQAA